MMAASRSEILQGTLDLMVLKTLDAMGPMHGYGIARRIEQMSEDALQVNQGTIYLCLIRLVQKGWIKASGGPLRITARRSSTRLRRPGESNSSPKPKTGSASPGLLDDFCYLVAGGSDAHRPQTHHCAASCALHNQ